MMTRRKLLATFGGVCAGTVARVRGASRQPNIVLIEADDLGYGDLGCYGSHLSTPNIDRIASEGVLFRDFYSAAPVCTPARAALLTGRYPARVGLVGVLQVGDRQGLAASETTIAGMLRPAGYRTACVGKWHLGALPEYLPTNRGFDEFFGLPYSNDMTPLPVISNTTVVDEQPRMEMLTQRFTEQAVSFIQRTKDNPFFLYLPHTAPHIPLAASAAFRRKSNAGTYGDVVRELDWSVGEVLKTLEENGLSENTLVMFSNDNGPWYQGSRGGLRGRKGETYEGGMRVPLVARLPGQIPPGLVTRGLATTMDLVPTMARLAGAELPGKPLDGMDIWPLFTGELSELDRYPFLYFEGWNVQCARFGRWKLHMSRYSRQAWNPDPPGGRVNLPLPRQELYDMENDSEEDYDVSLDNPEVVADIRRRVEEMVMTFPEPVGTLWRDTMRRQVEYTPPGALPIERRP